MWLFCGEIELEFCENASVLFKLKWCRIFDILNDGKNNYKKIFL